ncbi:MAG: hypothetical protein JXR19_04075 [Bacteroidia bacterium]
MDKITPREWLIWLAILIIDLALVLNIDSTYDSGDSVLHFLYSSQAFEYPKYLMDHWAKPVFVLLSAPFAQLGWWGMQFFNSLCILGSSFFLFQLFKSYHLKSWLAVLLTFSAPLYFLVQSSGLTEPLFALFLTASIYYLKKDQLWLSLVLLSFLPFVRSEGWIIAPIVIIYLISLKKFKWIPILLIGTVVYGIIGHFYYDDFLWMFNQNPYSGAEEKYGSGNWLHFFNQLPYVIGIPLFTLVLIGLYDGFYRAVRSQMSLHEFFLIYGIALGYFMAHTVFWAEGLFHSFGLNRVLIVIIPLFAFIAYRGIERIACAFSFINSKYIWYTFCGLVIIFPFTGNKAALRLPGSIQKEPLQILTDEVRDYCDSSFGERKIYYGCAYIPMIFDKDIDNSLESERIGMIKKIPADQGSLVVWDSYFAVTDQDITEEELNLKPELTLVKKFECVECRSKYWINVYLSESK